MGGGEVNPESVCGNGIVEGTEECDAAGSSESCNSTCEKRKCLSDCFCEHLGTRLVATCPALANFDDAKATCAKAGWKLALPNSQFENSRMRFAASSLGLELVWLGATDQTKEGDWLDVSDQLIWEGGAGGEAMPGRYEAWGNGQPDNYQSAQHCATLAPFSEWDDGACAMQLPYFCEEVTPKAAKGCGDGVVDSSEACDPGASATATCDLDCTTAKCGDGIVNTAAGEVCDDANKNPFDSCDDCQSTGLVAHYPLTEANGAVAWDLSGNDHHGTLTGGAVFSTAGRGLALDGTSGYVVVPAARAPQFSGAITYMALAQVEAPLPATGMRALISQNVEADQENFLRLEGPRLQAGSWVAATGNEVVSIDVAAKVPLVEFHHFAGRFDGKRWALFLDGVALTNMNASRGPLTLDADLLLGGRPSGGGHWTPGILRDVRIYDRSLSAAEILALAEASKSAVNNLALLGAASQSTDHPGYHFASADKAIDGNVDGSITAQSVTHTNDPNPAPWWQVQLAAPACVSEVELFNRTDCCSGRLANGEIQTSTDGIVFAQAASFATAVGVHQTFNFPRRQASYVRVKLAGSVEPLSLAEVQVFGIPGNCECPQGQSFFGGACVPCNLDNFAAYCNGSTASADSTRTGYSPARVIDGDNTTVTGGQESWTNDWPSSPLPQYFTINFNAIRTIGRVDLYASATREIQDYGIQYWDGAAWVEVANVTGNTSDHRSHTFAQVTTNQLRVRCSQGPAVQAGHARLNEIEVYEN